MVQGRAQIVNAPACQLLRGPDGHGPGGIVGGFVLHGHGCNRDAQVAVGPDEPDEVLGVDVIDFVLVPVPVAAVLTQPQPARPLKSVAGLHPCRSRPGRGQDTDAGVDGHDLLKDRYHILHVPGGIGRAGLPLADGEVVQGRIRHHAIGQVVIRVVTLARKVTGPDADAEGRESSLGRIEHLGQYPAALTRVHTGHEQVGTGIGQGRSGTLPKLILPGRINLNRDGLTRIGHRGRRVHWPTPLGEVTRCDCP